LVKQVIYVLEFKRTSDKNHNYGVRGEGGGREARASIQHDVLFRCLETVAAQIYGSEAYNLCRRHMRVV
jgi:hypothetical protein